MTTIESHSARFYTGLNSTQNKQTVIFDESALRFRNYNTKTGKAGKFISNKDGLAVLDSYKKIQSGDLVLAKDLSESPVYTHLNNSVVFDEHNGRFRNYNTKTGKAGKFVSNTFATSIVSGSSMQNSIIPFPPAAITRYQQPGALTSKAQTVAPINDSKVIPLEVLADEPVPDNVIPINTQDSSRSSRGLGTMLTSMGRRLKSQVSSTYAGILGGIAVLAGAAIFGLAAYNDYKGNTGLDETLMQEDALRFQVNLVKKVAAQRDQAVNERDKVIDERNGWASDYITDELREAGVVKESPIEPSQPMILVSTGSNQAQVKTNTVPSDVALYKKGNDAAARVSPGTGHWGEAPNIRQLSIENITETSAKRKRFLRDGQYDSVYATIRERAKKETLGQRDKRLSDSREGQAKNNWSNPMAPIISYVEYSAGTSGTNTLDSFGLAGDAATDLGRDIAATLTASYFLGDKALKANNFNLVGDWNQFIYSLGDERSRISGGGIPTEDPLSWAIDEATRAGVNGPTQVGLSTAGLAFGIPRSVGVPLLHVPGDLAYTLKNTERGLMGPLRWTRLPEGLEQAKNVILDIFHAPFQFGANSGTHKGGLSNSEDPARAAKERGSHAGSNAEKLAGLGGLGYTISTATQGSGGSANNQPGEIIGRVAGPGGN